MYVDTDFLFALTSPDDWLHAQATNTLEAQSDIHTSKIAYLEFLVHAYEPGDGLPFAALYVLANLLEVVPTNPQTDSAIVLAAATYLDDSGVTPFDAFHSAITTLNDGQIHWSDQIYDDLGIDRVPLEPSN